MDGELGGAIGVLERPDLDVVGKHGPREVGLADVRGYEFDVSWYARAAYKRVTAFDFEGPREESITVGTVLLFAEDGLVINEWRVGPFEMLGCDSLEVTFSAEAECELHRGQS